MPKNRIKTLLSDNQLVIIILTLLIYLVGCSNLENHETKEKSDVSNTFEEKVKFQKTERSFMLNYFKDNVDRFLTFNRNLDSSEYNYFNFQISSSKKVSLKDEIKILDKLWRVASDSISINLNSIMVGYPLEYSDILTNQINAFKNSDEWTNHSQNPITQNYDLVRKIMLESIVYSPMDSLLHIHGYKIETLSTEKHGYVPEKDLEDLGYSGDLKIPVPFMVWISVKKEPLKKEL